MYLYLLIGFLVTLFLFNYLNLGIREGLENSGDCGSTETLVYKNQGAIQNLQEQVEKIMNQMNSTVGVDAKQSADIDELTKGVASNKSIAETAQKLSDQNKASLEKMANAQKSKADALRQRASQLPPIKS